MTDPTIKVGQTLLTTLSDGHLDLPPQAFSNIDPKVLDKTPAPIRIGANVWQLKTATRNILIDSGSGSHLQAKYPATGQLGSELETQNIDRSAVTDIIITHMHADHIGGLMTGEKPNFPNATLHMAREEWTYWTDKDRPSHVPDAIKPLAGLIQSLASKLKYNLEQHEGETDLGEGIWLLPAPGHTPGHVAVRVDGGDKQVLMLGDAIISDALQFAHPDTTYVLDSYPDQAAKTRRALFEMMAADKIPFSATHLNTGAFGHVEADGKGFRYSVM